jgi:rhodanese-related sulfurtransferase
MKTLQALTLSLVFIAPAFAEDYQPVDKAALPAAKKTKAELYLLAPEAYEMKNKAPDKILFVDIRTRGEFMFLGSPTVTDANIPYVEMDDPPDWDDKNDRYKLAPNSDFTAAIEERMRKKGLTKSDRIILICRSGDRSALAANLLQQAGFGQVYSVIDGFEGDIGKDERRDVNGWKNAGLPWTYRFDKQKADLRQ